VEAELTVEERLGAAFLAAFTAYPYFSSGLALLVRRVIEIPSATMAVTRDGILLIDPRFLVKYGARQIAEVLVHELQHLIRDHGTRSDLIPAVDRYRWNVATDCEINWGLNQTFLPGDPCLPRKYDLPDGLLAEEYYTKLPQLSSNELADACSGRCGSGSGGEVVEGEPPLGTPEGRGEADVSRARREVAEAIVSHASRGFGSIAADLLRWASRELRPPKVHWRDKLRRLVRAGVSHASGKIDYTWSHPGRRQACQSGVVLALGGEDVILPALRGLHPNIAVGVDTSGSMGEDEILRAMSEVDGVLRAAGVPITLLACDCQMAGPPKKIQNMADAAKCLRGGGGTDFRVIFAEVEKLRPRPSMFIFMTDGCGPAPEAPPIGMRVLWVIMGRFQKSAPWGESVVIEEDPK
jgi:predicted metal-dependent peptidase